MVSPESRRTLSRGVGREAEELTPGWTAPVPYEPRYALTYREFEVLELIADGLANREIGEKLFLSEETVKSHVKTLLEKLHARTRAHAVAIALRGGLMA
jgi:DNA-binding NarL/FixJ family response regulator